MEALGKYRNDWRVYMSSTINFLNNKMYKITEEGPFIYLFLCF